MKKKQYTDENKKGALESFVKAIVVIILAFFLLGLILMFIKYASPKEFDLDRDVCEEHKCGCINEFGLPPQDEDCLKWHTKTLCEREPTNEACECDEWKERPLRIQINCQNPRLPNGDYDWEVCQNITNVAWDEANKYKDKTCIKAHQKNECEKGNTDYVLDIDKVFVVSLLGFCNLDSLYLYESEIPDEFIYNNNTYHFKGNDRMSDDCILTYWDDSKIEEWNEGHFEKVNIKSKKTCRKKTSLERFKDNLNKYDCEKLALDFTESCLTRCKYDYYEKNDEELKDIFKLKNCQI